GLWQPDAGRHGGKIPPRARSRQAQRPLRAIAAQMEMKPGERALPLPAPADADAPAATAVAPRQRSLGLRLVWATLAFCSLFILASVALLTWSAWNAGLARMDAELAQIEQIYSGTLS